ncbi:MAG: hypothetical protein LAT64_02595 [Phycisphaerales bacterium]|nr:hypothetical protein [Planctomycetota bacterium]MCH8507647.1 hypothetical protein [Phycisphaerales bacterium]
MTTAPPKPLVVTTPVHFRVGRKGARSLRVGPAAPPPPPGRVPRVARLMALAIRCEGLIRDGAVANQAELAAVGHVTRARLTQIMNLLHLAPDIQEAILDLPRVGAGRERITERHLRPITAEIDWGVQRRMWAGLRARTEQGTTKD